MKISFLGLSAFLIESIAGQKILLDPFDDRPEFQLGVNLPRDLDADFACFSHKDPDHYNPLIAKKYPHPSENLLKKTVIGNEFNGDEFEINILEIDGLTIAHFADQSVLLSKEQISAIGKIDIAIYSPPKADGKLTPKAMEVAKENLKRVNPKIIIWSHFITPTGWKDQGSSAELRNFFREYLSNNTKTNKNYVDRESFIELYYILENALELNNYFDGKVVSENSIEIKELPREKTSILFATQSTKDIRH